MKNSAKVWDEVWKDKGLIREDKIILANEESKILWKRLNKILQQEHKTLKGIKVIEIGSGTGTVSSLMAKRGAKITLLDFSAQALKRAKEFYSNNGLSAELIEGDALNMPNKLKGKFDISLSVGLTEHFKGKKRESINKAHLDVLKKGGLAIIIVPNKYNLPYRIFKKTYELTGKWKYGEEYPYSRKELLSFGVKFKSSVVALFGDDLYSSIKFLLPANFLRRMAGVGFPRSLKEIKKEKGTPLDNYLSYALVLVLRK